MLGRRWKVVVGTTAGNDLSVVVGCCCVVSVGVVACDGMLGRAGTWLRGGVVAWRW